VIGDRPTQAVDEIGGANDHIKDDIKKIVFDIPAGSSPLVRGKEVIIA
jgi:hypothetical protein